ncbi:uncharacterized protein LOC127243293 [Andrographis paniculata]|uniref:uncharacterized protein LOC127243293 n=1 Tax=Andrographis paniculata TaxID=175694 RepID=UPI0021E73553|nr:uncharacterized protein LOC127243293 [Andrographis paniculata]
MGKKPSAASANSVSEQLHTAARSGDLKAVQAICAANPLAVNSRDRHSRTPLHLAAWSGHAEVANYLCKNKAEASAAAMDDMGAIHFAAQKGHLEVIQILVAAGVSIKSTNRKGMTALHYAAQGSNQELIKYLLRKGASGDSQNKAGKSAVDLASSEDIRKLLAEYKSVSDKVVENGNEKSEKSEEEGLKMEDNESLQGHEEGKDEPGSVKRRGAEEDAEESQRETKKSRVALSHLLAADDADDENEEG